jgi:hypothetical protein
MSTALVGVLGVAVGALLSSALQRLAENRRERVAAIVAARVIMGDLEVLRAAVVALEDEPHADHVPVQTGAWHEHRAALAAVLPRKDWYVVAGCFDKAAIAALVLDKNAAGVNTVYRAQQAAPSPVDILHAASILARYGEPVLWPRRLRIKARIRSNTGG